MKEHEADAKTADLARKHGMSRATFDKWKPKFGGMDLCEAKRLKALEDENAKLKKLLTQQMLDAAALRELLKMNGRARGQRAAASLTRHRVRLQCDAGLVRDNAIDWHFIAPGKPIQNPFVESFNCRMRTSS